MEDRTKQKTKIIIKFSFPLFYFSIKENIYIFIKIIKEIIFISF